MKKEEQAHKDMLIKEITRMLRESEDTEMIQLIYLLLLKNSYN